MNGNTGTMNLVMTILGFAMSATFVIFVCARLLCVRIRQRHVRSRSSLEPTPEDQLERSLNGMDAVVVASLPTLKYSQGVFASKDDALCTVCLGEYEDKEVLRLLPRCGHAFHLDCIDAWLRQHSTCPICRISLRTGDVRGMPSPLMNRAAMTRFSPGALPDSMFEQLQQQPQWSEARRSGLSSPTRATDTDRSVSYGQNLPSRWRSNEAAEILWHMSRRQYPIDLESAMRVEEDVLRSRQEEGTRVSTGDSPASGEIYFLGQRREIRYPRSGKWSVWLWRRWERGEPGSSPLTQEHPSEWPSTSSSPAAAPVRLYSPSSFNLRHNAAYADEGTAAAQTSGSSLDHLAIPVAQVATAVPVSSSEFFTGVDAVEQGITERRPSQQEISEERPTQRQKSVTRSQITLQGVSPGEEVADKMGR